MSINADKGRPQVHERLRRLLFLVPFVARNPGLSVEEVAKEAGVSREELLEELDLLTLVGRPPFQPDDFVDIFVEDGKVYVELDQRLSAPPRLTAAEGVALAAAAALLKPAAGDALTQALAKLETVLPPHAVQRYRDMAKTLDVTMEAPDGLSTLSQAIVERREVDLDYFTAGRGQTERRRVQPHELFSHRGLWYLAAHCLSRGDERLFRLDRISGLSLTDIRFEAPATSPRALPGIVDADGEVRVRFEPAVAPWIVERFGDGATALPDGAVEVTVPGDSERWLTQWILSFGGAAVVLSPQWAKDAVARAARASLQSM
ncbi:MAG: WYL domain-containing protein [Myxococcota bacterium]